MSSEYARRQEMIKKDSNYINFGDYVRKELNQQCQYVSRYLTGSHGDANLGEGLRYIGSQADYHGIMIHKDDAKIFVKQYHKYMKEIGCEKEMTTKIIIDKEDLIELIRMSGLDYEDSKSLLDSKNKTIFVSGFQNAGDICIIDYIGD